MRCEDCKHYFRSLNFNSCAVVEAECFMTREDCDLVNDDGSINKDHPYYKKIEEDDKNRVFMFDMEETE
jgi:hypothetical protein